MQGLSGKTQNVRGTSYCNTVFGFGSYIRSIVSGQYEDLYMHGFRLNPSKKEKEILFKVSQFFS